ncbi:hypothetical protein N7540_009600 [Penicillium herquei]|nr:hypothetical protein N7540_009600 [Penicillium herquei]
MKVSKLYIYPIKSLRPTPLTAASICPEGIQYDRRYMLMKVERGKDGAEPTLKNMHIPHFPEMGLFQTAVEFPKDNDDAGKIIVTYNPSSTQEMDDLRPREMKQIEIPIRIHLTQVKTMKEIKVVMHKSSTTGYVMDDEYNDWFSECFGFPVILAYLGKNSREVLGTLAPENRNRVPWWTLWYEAVRAISTVPILVSLCWIFVPILALQYFNYKTPIEKLTNRHALFGIFIIIVGWLGISHAVLAKLRQTRITFADCASFLVISQTSVDNVSARFESEGEEVDHTKFRPNIVVSGADSPFEEDFWTELKVGSKGFRLLLTGNCVRCQSLNVDYQTGKMGDGESGAVLKKLMKDRRVDRGAKFSPVFGRYGFMHWTHREGIIRVGDEIEVVAHSKERTITDWPGLTN